MNWIATYNEKIALHAELEYINKNLQGIIEHRTTEVKKINEELQSTLDLKGRIFSIIAHDLKSPISSLAQYSDLLIEQSQNTENESISISATIKGDQVEMKVVDSGIGINQKTIDEIMSSSIASTHGTEGEKGTGLGFLVIKDLVRINKGTLHIES
ncbi:MAG: ATP-binding protein [Bacteroidales bacterium]|jgi:light-regulated signal transduction histidine kinase (bacteriophytochrome)|nr:ATP-binding protein [Bacteroidales bacterium]